MTYLNGIDFKRIYGMTKLIFQKSFKMLNDILRYMTFLVW